MYFQVSSCIDHLFTAFSPGAHYSLSVETAPSASLDLNDNSLNLTHPLAGTRNTSQGVDSETLLYIQGSDHGMCT